MKPINSKIFLDGGDPQETKDILSLLGFLDGQTTNPTWISKNPQTIKKLASDQKFTQQELLDLYKGMVQQISSLIPNGSISIQVYTDKATKAEQMLEMGKMMYSWIPNAHIKYPTTYQGLKAASESVKLGMRINMTLMFSQKQAAAVYSATKGAKKGQVYISPFIGRLDDRGENGMSLIENIIRMFKNSDGHVEVLAASVRNMDHFFGSISLGVDIITVPYKFLKQWKEKNMPMPEENFVYPKGELVDIPYYQLDLDKNWQEFDILHELTDQGIKKFSDDWKSLIG